MLDEGRELTDQEVADLNQKLALDGMFNRPVPLPVRFGTENVAMADGTPAVVFELITPAGSSKVMLSRADALAISSHLKKAAQTGPQLVAAPAGLVIPR